MKYVLLTLMGALGVQVSYLGLGTQSMRTEKFVQCQIQSEMMSIQESKLAVNRGTSEEIRNYSSDMMHEHELVLNELKDLAIAKNIVIPFELSTNDAKSLTSLMDQQGDDFDKKFIDLVIMDHKRDIKALENATRSKDPDIQVFAQHYLPIYINHLSEAEDLGEKIKQPKP